MGASIHDQLISALGAFALIVIAGVGTIVGVIVKYVSARFEAAINKVQAQTDANGKGIDGLTNGKLHAAVGDAMQNLGLVGIAGGRRKGDGPPVPVVPISQPNTPVTAQGDTQGGSNGE